MPYLETWVLALALPLIVYITFGNSLKLYELWFPHFTMRSRRIRERMDWDRLSVRGSKKGIMELQKFHWPIRGSWDEKHLVPLVPEAPNPRLPLRTLVHATYQANLSHCGHSPWCPSQGHSVTEPGSRGQPCVRDGLWPKGCAEAAPEEAKWGSELRVCRQKASCLPGDGRPWGSKAAFFCPSWVSTSFYFAMILDEVETVSTDLRSAGYLLRGCRHQQVPNRRNGPFPTFCQFYSYLLFSPEGSNKGKEPIGLSACPTALSAEVN